ncbi:MAG: winged helix-turn-helix transcriptional regulator [Nitrospira sp.]|nr:winged helix-turn-helix transcriptional regulator [Nitrospira sp.]MBL8054211.1 winged helix-turn-helix transcriptional regulator [Nitrospira sp.]
MKSALETDVLSPRECASVLKALADETRLRILESLLADEKCVSDLVRELGCPQPHVSHHLRILRDSGVVEGLREGKQVCYRIAPIIKRALANQEGKALNFGCCELRFPESVLATAKSRALHMVHS